jgi:hypothetical protein
MNELALITKIIDMAMTLTEQALAFRAEMQALKAQIQTMVDEGRDPTPAEWADLKARSDAELESRTMTTVLGDLRPSTAASIGYQVVPDADFFLDDQATSDTVATTVVESFLANITGALLGRIAILPGGTTADVPAGDIVLTGTAWDDTAQAYIHKTVNVTLTANQSTVEVSAVPFTHLHSITFPIQDGPDATYDVGIANQIDFRIPIGGSAALSLISTFITASGAAAAGQPITFTKDSVLGSTFDITLYSINMQSPPITEDVNFFDPQARLLVPGDNLLIAGVNGNALTISIAVNVRYG